MIFLYTEILPLLSRFLDVYALSVISSLQRGTAGVLQSVNLYKPREHFSLNGKQTDKR